MSGAGDDTAGEAPAGEDELADPSTPRRVTAPVALRFDGKTRDFLRDDDGRYLSEHPVDQRVALALQLELGKVAGAPTIGHGIRSVRPGPSVRSAAESRVRLALAELLAARDIQILTIRVETPDRGAVFVEVDYLNLRLPAAEKRTARAQVT